MLCFSFTPCPGWLYNLVGERSLTFSLDLLRLLLLISSVFCRLRMEQSSKSCCQLSSSSTLAISSIQVLINLRLFSGIQNSILIVLLACLEVIFMSCLSGTSILAFLAMQSLVRGKSVLGLLRQQTNLSSTINKSRLFMEKPFYDYFCTTLKKTCSPVSNSPRINSPIPIQILYNIISYNPPQSILLNHQTIVGQNCRFVVVHVDGLTKLLQLLMLTKGQLRRPLRVFTILSIIAVCITVGVLVVMVMQSYIGFGITANNLSCVSSINYFAIKYSYPSITVSFAGAVIAFVCGTTAFIISVREWVKLRKSTEQEDQDYTNFTQAKTNALAILFMISAVELIVPTGYYLSFMFQVTSKCSSYSVSLYWIIIYILSGLALAIYIFCIFYMCKLLSSSKERPEEKIEKSTEKQKQASQKKQKDKKTEPEIVEPTPVKEQKIPLLNKTQSKPKQAVPVPEQKQQKQQPKQIKKEKKEKHKQRKNPSLPPPSPPPSPVSVKSTEPPHQNNTNIHFHFSPGSFNANPQQLPLITQASSALPPQNQLVKSADVKSLAKQSKRSKKRLLPHQQVIVESREEDFSSDSDDRFYKKQKTKRNKKNKANENKERFASGRNFTPQYAEIVRPDTYLSPGVQRKQKTKKQSFIPQTEFQTLLVPQTTNHNKKKNTNIPQPNNHFAKQSNFSSRLLSDSIVHIPEEQTLTKQNKRLLVQQKVQILKEDSFYRQLQQNEPKQTLDVKKLASFFHPTSRQKSQVIFDQHKIHQNSLDQYIADLNQSYAQITKNNHQDQTNFLSQKNYQSVLSKLEASRQISQNTGSRRDNLQTNKNNKSAIKPMLLIDFIRQKYS